MSDEQIIRLISNHDLMVQEDEVHEEFIERLMSTKTMTKAFVSDLRELARNQGFSNIGISDDDH
jgi:hypothetical protein